MSVLIGLLTTLCSVLGLITGAFSLASILGQEVEEKYYLMVLRVVR